MSVSPWPVFASDEIDAATAVLASGKVNYWTGEHGKAFEAEFAAHCNVKHAIAVANGSLALDLALEAAGIGSGDEVVVTPRSFVASASCVVRLGARPVFADVSLDSQNLTPESVADVLTPNTRAIVAVHHAGWPCDMDGLMALAEQHELLLIEDCAQAHGATYKGRPVGGLGHVAAFSFCQDKIISTGGEGGMLVTNDTALWKKAWSIKDHGKNYDSVFAPDAEPGFRWLHDSFGTNMRMTEMQSAIGRLQLAKLSEWSRQRRANAARLTATLQSFDAIRVPLPAAELEHAFYRLYAMVDAGKLRSGWDRDRIMNEINARDIPCFSGSCPEVYREKAFRNAGIGPPERLPNASSLGSQSLAFLVHPGLTRDDLDRSCAAIAAVLVESAT